MQFQLYKGYSFILPGASMITITWIRLGKNLLPKLRGGRYARAAICSARCAASCSTPKMKLDALRDSQLSPRK